MTDYDWRRFTALKTEDLMIIAEALAWYITSYDANPEDAALAQRVANQVEKAESYKIRMESR